MEASTAPWTSCLLDENTFTENFMNRLRPRKTYLCYKVEILDGDARVPLDEKKGFVRNKVTDPACPQQAGPPYCGTLRVEGCQLHTGCPTSSLTPGPCRCYRCSAWNQGANEPGMPRHAECYFLDRIRSWNLDRGLHYRLTCFISWTPCHSCAQELATFLGENSHVSLHIFASRIYRRPGYEAGILTLRAAGAQIAIMTSKEFQHCWENFVDHQERPFRPWVGLEVESQHQCNELQAILQTQAN
ncbi:DNA dC-_dU-editing enzyme APOBEC-3A isoform X2 [Neophocaena asiaeorientalis asiaeorientalis]|uniref:DNA dC->dU-editing enzyme APOBEC-3A isoform X2 n=1 Tax=Neophocaena asiaeorientalis asiaeorientalis TaxID=1706337 RepID=A0A341CR79_NEOAA|nr:DNA dC->dU-editing enzyme APOBEC-3A isoform X2 [Neophocaena asiaeorientalis asiaeorientalis]